MLFSCPAGAVAAAGRRSGGSSGRSRKKHLESSFSIDFRSYVREFLVPISMLLRPSVPCCFPVRQVRSQQQEKEAGAAAAVAGKSRSNLHFLSISEVRLESFWCQFLCSSVLPCHGSRTTIHRLRGFCLPVGGPSHSGDTQLIEMFRFVSMFQ